MADSSIVSDRNKLFWVTCRSITRVASQVSSCAFVIVLAGITTHLSKQLPYRLTQLPAQPHFLCYAESISKADLWCQLFLLKTSRRFTGPQLLDQLQGLIPEITNWDRNHCQIRAVLQRDVSLVLKHARDPATPFCDEESSEDDEDQSEDLEDSSDISEDTDDGQQDPDFSPSHDESSDSESDSVASSSEEEEEISDEDSDDESWVDATILIFQVDDLLKSTLLKALEEMKRLRAEFLDPTTNKSWICKRELGRIRDTGDYPGWQGGLLAWRQGNLLTLVQEIWRGSYPEWLRVLIATHLPHPRDLMTYARFCHQFPLTPACCWEWDEFVEMIPGLIDYFKRYPLEARIWQG